MSAPLIGKMMISVVYRMTS